jgi:hypothetical protein
LEGWVECGLKGIYHSALAYHKSKGNLGSTKLAGVQSEALSKGLSSSCWSPVSRFQAEVRKDGGVEALQSAFRLALRRMPSPTSVGATAAHVL